LTVFHLKSPFLKVLHPNKQQNRGAHYTDFENFQNFFTFIIHRSRSLVKSEFCVAAILHIILT
jgi:hypothetical protein